MGFMNNESLKALLEKIKNSFKDINTNFDNKLSEAETDINNKLVGQKTPQGGEIFNDYENNKAIAEYSSAKGYNTIAGCQGFKILGYDDSIDNILSINNTVGVEIGDIISLFIAQRENNASHPYGNYDLYASVKAVTGNNIVLSKALPENYQYNSEYLDYIWFPYKPALNGDITIGTSASAEGYETKATTTCSHSEGYNTTALGKYAHTEGDSTIAGYAAHAEGKETQAIGRHSHAEGDGSVASGGTSHAEGYNTKAEGYNTHAEGSGTKATNNAAHAEGLNTVAQKDGAHSEGKGAVADGIATHAEGEGSKNYAKASHVEGFNAKVGIFDGNGNLSTKSTESFVGAHAEGYYTKAQKDGAHAEGDNTQAFGKGSHAEGSGTKAISLNYQEGITGGNHAEGYNTNATFPATHAEGLNTTASHIAAHSEGQNTKATGKAAHAEGNSTTASGFYSHAEGTNTIASGMNSHVSGLGTIAMRDNQTVVGTYNIKNWEPNRLFVVGNGTSDSDRKDAFVVNADGTATIQTAGTTDKSVVNYSQLKTYVAENGKSPWDAQSKLLFSNGDVKIINHAASSTKSEGIIQVGEYYANETGLEYSQIKHDRIFVHHYADDKETSIDTDGLSIERNYIFQGAVRIDVSGISYSYTPDPSEPSDPYSGTSTWKELLTTINNFKNINPTDYVKNTDYGSQLVAGLCKGNASMGTYIDDNGTIIIQPATEEEINEKTNGYKPIVPTTLDYAVKSVTYNKEEIDALKSDIANNVIATNNVINQMIILDDDFLQESFINTCQNGVAYTASVGSVIKTVANEKRAIFAINAYDKDVFVIPKNGYMIIAHYLDENDVVTQSAKYLANGGIIPKNQRFALQIYNIDNTSTMTDEEAKGVVTIQNEESKEKKRKICGAFLDGKFSNIAYSQIQPFSIPANSAEHYQYVGQTNGFDAIKGDVQITSDNQLVMCHDKGYTLNDDGRITTFNSSNCTLIRNMTYEQVIALEFATQYESAYVHPTGIDSLLRVCKKYGKFPYITIRDENIDIIAPILIDKLREYSLETHCIINSFTLDSLATVRQYSDYVFLSQVLQQNQTLSQKIVDRIDQYGNVVITMFDNNGSTIETNLEMMKHAKNRGIRIFGAVFSNTENIELLLNNGFSGCQSYVPWV